jgi:hypothetical protein
VGVPGVRYRVRPGVEASQAPLPIADPQPSLGVDLQVPVLGAVD